MRVVCYRLEIVQNLHVHVSLSELDDSVPVIAEDGCFRFRLADCFPVLFATNPPSDFEGVVSGAELDVRDTSEDLVDPWDPVCSGDADALVGLCRDFTGVL